MRRLLLLVAAILAVLPLTPLPARACDCAAPDLAALLDDADAAFIGTMLDKQGAPQEFEARYVFQVSRWVKSDLGDTVEVVSGANSAGCGWDSPVRGEIGVFLHRDGDRLWTGLCSVTDAALLAETAVAHQPGPDAVPPLDPAALGMEPDPGPGGSATARIVFGLIVLAAVAAVVVSSRRRGRSDR